MLKYEPEIRQFIVDKFLFGEFGELDGQASLLETGIMDSTGILELIVHLEKQFNVKVNDDDLVPENFDTIDAICAFLNRKNS
jgi:acyl carrier protein